MEAKRSGGSKLVRSVLDFDDTVAERVMTPRVDIISIDLQTDIEQTKGLSINSYLRIGSKFGKLPKTGDYFIDNAIKITALQMDGNRILLLQVQ